MREQKIVEELYRSKQHLSLEDLSERFGVSTRTISNDIKYLTQSSIRFGFEVHLKRKVGYYLQITDKDKFNAYLQNNREDTIMSSKDRLDTIVACLLLEKEYLTQESIADLLQVSKSIIKVDMPKVEKLLFEHSLQLVKKAHYGLTLQGDLMNRKLYLLELYEKEHPYVVQFVEESVGTQNIKDLEKELIVALKHYDLNTNYIELKKIDMFLRITLCTLKKGMREEVDHPIEGTVYERMARELAQTIQRIYDLKLSEADIDHTARYLKQKTKPNQAGSLYDQDLKEDIETFLKEADAEYHTMFQEDEEFKKSLLAHVSLLLDRLHQSISFSNPLVNEISVKYPVIFNISIKFSAMLEERYHVKTTQDEIGFIATHFAAHIEKELHKKLNSFEKIAIICSSGGGSAFLIKLKLESIFSSSKIQTFSLLEMEEVRSFAPDIIFTIRQLDEAFSVPIILIKELLDDEDIRNIKNMFEYRGSHEATLLNKKTFASLFHKQTFQIFTSGSYAEMIRSMADEIEQLALAQDGYREAVEERENVLSTIYANGIAIPHPIDMCGIEDRISIGIVKHDLRENGKPVRLIFLVNLQKGDLEFHQNITRVLFDVMSDEALVEKIRNSDSYEDFMKSIAHLKF